MLGQVVKVTYMTKNIFGAICLPIFAICLSAPDNNISVNIKKMRKEKSYSLTDRVGSDGLCYF